MYIQSIEIKNFRRFAEYQCDFDPHFTLLMGPNGVGKSSLLRAVYLALAPLLGAAGVRLAGIEADEVHRVDTIDPAGERWRTPVYPTEVAVTLTIGEESVLVAQRRLGGPLLSVNQRPDLTDRTSHWFGTPAVSDPIPLIARFGAADAVQGTGLAGAVQQPFESKQEVWQRAQRDAVDARALAQWFQYNELRTLQEQQRPLIYRVARQAVLAAIHAEDVNYVVRDNQLMVKYADPGWQPFDQLSDGQRRVAAIFCELAIRCAALNSHLGERCIEDTPGIVTIDELDLHLHPNWQRAIVGDLRRVFPNLQFIVASHSPFLLQAAYEHGKVLEVASGQFIAPADNSIEDIAESVMGVPQPQRGQRFLELKQAAQAFYDLLETQASTPEEQARLKARLDAAMAQFANDPAAAAWLGQRRLAAGH